MNIVNKSNKNACVQVNLSLEDNQMSLFENPDLNRVDEFDFEFYNSNPGIVKA